MRILFVTSVLILFCAGKSYGQLSLSPSSVFIDPKTKTATMAIKNNSKDRKEISVRFRYGYLDYNEAGKPHINYEDTVSEARYSLCKIIMAIPPKMILNPGEESVIMLKLKESSALPDGAYFTRVIIETSNAESNVDENSGKIESGIGVNIKIVGAVMYLKGKVNTSLEITDISHCLKDSSLDFSMSLKREKGNAPYLGRMDAYIYDVDGNIIDSITGSNCTVYFQGKIILSFGRITLKPGKYYALVHIDTQREDIPEHYIIPTDKITRKYDFEIPE